MIVPVYTVAPVDPAVTRCRAEASFDTSGMTIIVGTGDAEQLLGTDGPDLVCGFGGNDWVPSLYSGDVFLGDSGNDLVQYMHGGIFNGGADIDEVGSHYGGTYTSVEIVPPSD